MTSEVSKSSCLSGGMAAFKYVRREEIVMSSEDSYVVANRYVIDANTKFALETNFLSDRAMSKLERNVLPPRVAV